MFDGDQYTYCIALDWEMIKDFDWHRPHFAIHSYSRPRTFNSNMALPDTDTAVISHWIEVEEEEFGLIDELKRHV